METFIIKQRIVSRLRQIKYRFIGTGRTAKRTNPYVQFPYFVREGTTDESVEKEIFFNRQSYKKEDFGQHPKWIIDAGANIGLRSLWFANLFPESQIIAIEPENSNYELCVRNTKPYPNITCIKAALWRNDSYLQMTENPTDPQPWAFIVKECNAGNNNVRGVSITDIMQEYSIPFIDVLKIDVEGSEKEIFEDSGAWINFVGTFMVELHDRFRYGTAKAFFSAINTLDYIYLPEYAGDNCIVRIRKANAEN